MAVLVKNSFGSQDFNASYSLVTRENNPGKNAFQLNVVIRQSVCNNT